MSRDTQSQNKFYGGNKMREKNFNLTDVRLGFSCPYDMEKEIINECKRICDTKSGVIRRALMFYFDRTNKLNGGEQWYDN